MTNIATPNIRLAASPPPPPLPHTPSFTVLPAEVRLQIYDYLLYLPPINTAHPHDDDGSRVLAAILLASRQIYAEAAAVLYGRNTFIAHPSLLADFPCLYC